MICGGQSPVASVVPEENPIIMVGLTSDPSQYSPDLHHISGFSNSGMSRFGAVPSYCRSGLEGLTKNIEWRKYRHALTERRLLSVTI
ncbi:hypothetical protein RRG08_029168 [Elysia crispata]|uniref:Uncharacterized protein n=1 Tax=Elysia crispata TaxID=231223 RepID=A0AAE1DZH7_9GAST|nr:hypothetical protein RRG08_029168 [Elysia crispata]